MHQFLLSDRQTDRLTDRPTQCAGQRDRRDTVITHRDRQVAITQTDLEVSKFGESVDDDAKDDVETDGCDEDEEGHVKYDEKSELEERVVGRMTYYFLPYSHTVHQQRQQSILNYCFMFVLV